MGAHHLAAAGLNSWGMHGFELPAECALPEDSQNRLLIYEVRKPLCNPGESRPSHLSSHALAKKPRDWLPCITPETFNYVTKPVIRLRIARVDPIVKYELR